jgi:hypothetical protein
MNPRNKRPTASDLIPTGKAIKEMSYEEMEVFYSQRKEPVQTQAAEQQSEKGSNVWPDSIRTYRNEL